MTKVKNLKIYSTPTCVYCHAEKEYLDQKGIYYEEVSVDDNDKAEELMRLSGQLGVPFTVVTKEDGTEVKILGFDRPRLNEALGI